MTPPTDMDRDRALLTATNRYTGFQNLMRHRVNEILLVSSLYDSFILAQDGQLAEHILSEFMELNLYHTPNLTRMAKASEALAAASNDPRFDLIITTTHVGDMHVADFARRAREAGVRQPIVLLTYDGREIEQIHSAGNDRLFDRIFIWQGDVRILLAIVKQIEDQQNVDHDTRVMGAQAVLLVEDNIHFYSSYLPTLYAEIMHQSQMLLGEGLNAAHKIMRMRARPKILLCTSFEEAWELYRRYKDNLLGVITDIEYMRSGEKDPRAGQELVRRIKERGHDVPMLLQSFDPAIQDLAEDLGVKFIRKDSPTLLHDLRQFMNVNFGFGDFVFRTEEGNEIDRAPDLKTLEEKLHSIPEKSLLFHAERNHFSNWMKARTEFGLAAKLAPRKVKDFETIEAMRWDIISSIRDFRHERERGLVAEFRADSFDPASSFAIIGGGSMGGKARGLAFLSHMNDHYDLRDRFDEVQITIPTTAVLCTDFFDEFIEMNGLEDFALTCDNQDEVRKRFVKARFPKQARRELEKLLERMNYPLAVRSSGLLEDSHYQPFAGIYDTFMLPNNHPDSKHRLNDLIKAIKLVYASTFSGRSRAYMDATPYRLEEEKMAVIVQRLVGAHHEQRFYPNFSGVARSHNFYAAPPAESSDGIASVALGFGGYVADGGEGVRFCPRYPKHNLQFSGVEDYLDYGQKYFYAMQLPDPESPGRGSNLPSELNRFELDVAIEDDTLAPLGSTYSPENDRIYDGLGREGTPLVTFAPILKHKVFPLPEILETFLDLGSRGMGRPVELEFAVNLSVPRGIDKEFVLLQMRPLVISQEMEDLSIDDFSDPELICRSSKVLGFGQDTEIRDIVAVDRDSFDRRHTRDVAAEVARLNARLSEENRPYLLIGLGRWGSSDPWLGIPVNWEQIGGVRVIVEAGLPDMKVQPSEGAHFFHNITSLGIGYFTVNPDHGQGFVDWKWLKEMPGETEQKYVRHIRSEQPLDIRMNGSTQQGIIIKPGVGEHAS